MKLLILSDIKGSIPTFCDFCYSLKNRYLQMLKNIYIKKRFSGLNKFSEKKVGQKVGQLWGKKWGNNN